MDLDERNASNLQSMEDRCLTMSRKLDQTKDEATQ